VEWCLRTSYLLITECEALVNERRCVNGLQETLNSKCLSRNRVAEYENLSWQTSSLCTALSHPVTREPEEAFHTHAHVHTHTHVHPFWTRTSFSLPHTPELWPDSHTMGPLRDAPLFEHNAPSSCDGLCQKTHTCWWFYTREDH